MLNKVSEMKKSTKRTQTAEIEKCIFPFDFYFRRLERKPDGIDGNQRRTVRGTIRGALAMSLWTVVTPFALLFCVFLGFRRLRAHLPRRRTKSVAIVVLGDIGRSPRMLYHANSFVAREYKTHIVAYRGESHALARAYLVLMHCPRCRIESAPRLGRIRLCEFRVSRCAAGMDD